MRILTITMLLGPAVLAGCAGPPQAPPPVDVKKLEADWQEDIAASLEAFLLEIDRGYAPKSAFNLSNSLKQSVALLEARISQLEEKDRQLEPEELKELMDPVRASLAGIVVRVDRLESDMNATLADLQGMREEVRAVLGTLAAYRDASRTTLELQREVLSRQLRALDEALAPTVGDGRRPDGE